MLSNSRSRTANSIRNASISVISQVVVIVLGFITRTVFLAHLGVELLGVNTLLTSVVSLLAFADLGISSALMYALYKPLKAGDSDNVAAIVRYAGKLFRWVALFVGVAGLILTPFIHRIVRLDNDIAQIEYYYIVLLADTVISYLMLNRQVLLNADQKIYLTKAISIFFTVLRSVAQILSLVLFESFLIFLLIQVVFTFANNLTVYFRVGKLYPYIKDTSSSLEDSDRRSILSSVRAMMIFRIGGLILNNSSPLLISVIAGTAVLGYYSNYMLIVSAAIMITEVIFSAFTPSVGNLVASGDKHLARRVFDEVVLFAVLLHGFIAVGIVVLLDEFIVLWLGAEFLLETGVVFALVLNFYVTGTLAPLWSFRSATGLFRQTQWVMLMTAALSILFAFSLGSFFGLIGIILSPAVARLLTGAWYEPWVLIRSHLSGRVLPYFILQIGSLVLWGLLAVVVIKIGSWSPGGVLGSMVSEAGLLAVLLPLVSWVVFRKTSAFRPIIDRLRSLVKKSRPSARKEPT